MRRPSPVFFRFFLRLVMPRGVIDYERKIPATDVIIIATTNVVLVHKELHPAVIDLLVQTMLEAHNEPGLFQKVGDFSTQTELYFPVAFSARDFYKNGPSFLNRFLPFWMTNYAQRTIAVLAAVTAIMLPLFPICRCSTNGTCVGDCSIGTTDSSHWKPRS